MGARGHRFSVQTDVQGREDSRLALTRGSKR
jgi:hypothetical protein